MPNNTPPAFKRLNFFTGFFTTADDWQQGQEYHLEKRKLHLRGLHTPGIIPGKGGELMVTAGDGLAVRVGPGAALDREGNLLYLPDLPLPPAERTIPIPLPEGLPKTVYVYIKYADNPTDPQYNVDYPEYSGHSRVTESPKIFLPEKPDDFEGVELARIALQPDATRITDPINPESPGPNEIDRRYAIRAGAVDWRRDTLDKELREQLHDLKELLAAQRKELDASHLARSQRLHERLQKLHEYHLAVQRRHNQGLYRPGLLPDVLEELAVKAVDGLTVEVRPGAALDGAGNELYLDQAVQLSIPPPTAPRRVYIVAGYEDRFDAYLRDLESPFDAPPGGSRYRTLKVSLDDAAPDPTGQIELARIDLAADATEIRLPVDPGRPQRNEIDQRGLRPACAKAVVKDRLAPELRDRVTEVMQSKRSAFAALGTRFPVPSATDVRQTAVSLDTLARNGSLQPERLAELWGLFVALEQDVGREIGAAYPPVVAKPEFKQYQDAVAALGAALYARENEQVLLNRQSDVATAARDLAGVVFEAPEAVGGPEQTIRTLTGAADVTLDAGASQAHADQKIVRYHWEKEE